MKMQCNKIPLNDLLPREANSLLMRALKLFRSTYQHKQTATTARSSTTALQCHSKFKSERAKCKCPAIKRTPKVQYVPIRVSTFPSNHIPQSSRNQLVKIIYNEKCKLESLAEDRNIYCSPYQSILIESIKGTIASPITKESRMLTRHSSLPSSALSVIPKKLFTTPDKISSEFRNHRIKSHISRAINQREKGTPCSSSMKRNEFMQNSSNTLQRFDCILPSVKNSNGFTDFEQLTGW